MVRDIFERLGNVIGKGYLIIIIICLALIIPAVLGASQVETRVGVETLASHDSQEYEDYKRLTAEFSDEVIILLLEADDIEHLVQRDNIVALEAFEEQMASRPNVAAAVGPASLIEVMAQQAGASSIPDDSTLLQMLIDPDTGSIREQFAGLFPDERHAMVSIIIKAGTEDNDVYDLVDLTEITATGAGFKDVTYIVTGLPDVEAQNSEEMSSAMQLMIIVAAILMLVILALVFQVRNFFAWRWLPLGVVLIGIIYTFGIMGAFDVPLTYVTIASFPILIGLGVGFTIQFHNRYDTAIGRGETQYGAVIETMTRIGPATGIAVVVICLGFAAMLTSPLPMIVDFAYSLIIGTIVMYLAAAFLLLPILYWNDQRRKVDNDMAAQAVNKRDGFVERGLRKLSSGVIKHPVIIISLAIVLCISGYIMDHNIDAQPDTIKYVSSDLESVHYIMRLQELSGGRLRASILIEADDIVDPQVMEWMLGLQDRIETNEPDSVGTVDSIASLVMQFTSGDVPDESVTKQLLSQVPHYVTLNLVNSDFTAANMSLTLPGMNADDLRALRSRLEEYVSDPPDGVAVAVTGKTILNDKMSSGLTGGREKMTLIGIGLVFAGLFVLFRFRLKRAIVAALPTAFIIGWAAIVIYLMGIEYTPAGATRGAMSMGIGVMFTILLMNRYFEERDSGQAPTEAVTSAMVNVGRPIVACGLTVIGGFAALLMADAFPLIIDFGIITLVTVFLALVSTLIVLPPMIVSADTWLGKGSAEAIVD